MEFLLKHHLSKPVNYTVRSSWNLIAVGGKKKRKENISLLHTRAGIFFCLGGGGEGSGDNIILWALLFVTMTTAPSRAGVQRSAASSSLQQLVPLSGVDTHPRQQQQQPGATAVTISLPSPTALTVYLIFISSQPSYCTHYWALFFPIFVYVHQFIQ